MNKDSKQQQVNDDDVRDYGAARQQTFRAHDHATQIVGAGDHGKDHFTVSKSDRGINNPAAVIGQWFFKRRGKAVAIKGFGNEIGVNLLLAPIFQAILDANGWRSANTIFAGLCVVVALPAGLFLHHTPESVGCLPDGDHRCGAVCAFFFF